jgi:ubiquinol-cytochrome c reductase cytochrome b subunit
MTTPPAHVTGRSAGEERHLPPRSGGPAVKRLAAGTRWLVPDVLRRDPQDRWAAVFGRIAGYSFAVAVVTGIPLLPFFRPSMASLVYHGSYRLLDGVTVSRAYRSVLALSFDVRGGLLIRQVHHWPAGDARRNGTAGKPGGS